jgi:hypothetical protein
MFNLKKVESIKMNFFSPTTITQNNTFVVNNTEAAIAIAKALSLVVQDKEKTDKKESEKSISETIPNIPIP